MVMEQRASGAAQAFPDSGTAGQLVFEHAPLVTTSAIDANSNSNDADRARGKDFKFEPHADTSAIEQMRDELRAQHEKELDELRASTQAQMAQLVEHAVTQNKAAIQRLMAETVGRDPKSRDMAELRQVLGEERKRRGEAERELKETQLELRRVQKEGKNSGFDGREGNSAAARGDDVDRGRLEKLLEQGGGSSTRDVVAGALNEKASFGWDEEELVVHASFEKSIPTFASSAGTEPGGAVLRQIATDAVHRALESYSRKKAKYQDMQSISEDVVRHMNSKATGDWQCVSGFALRMRFGGRDVAFSFEFQQANYRIMLWAAEKGPGAVAAKAGKR